MSFDVKDVSNYPQMEYFMNESVCDVVFVVEGQRLPAMKQILIFNNKVFKAMFSENFKESKDKEVVVKDTTFEAFKTMIQFLYCNQLVVTNPDDLSLIEEVCKLADRYEVLPMIGAVCDQLKTIAINYENMGKISEIAVNYKNEELMSCVQSFVENNFESFLTNSDQNLIAFNDSTHNQLFKVFVKNYRKLRDDSKKSENKLKIIKDSICSSCHIITLDKSHSCRICNKRLPQESAYFLTKVYEWP